MPEKAKLGGMIGSVSIMTESTPAPIDLFQHSHLRMNDLARELGRVLNMSGSNSGSTEVARALAEDLRDELLEHFANEEEGLFPFIRECVPVKVDIVDRLAAAHNVICGAVVRLAHLIVRDG